MKLTNFSDKVYHFTQENALFTASCHLLVAVSGGPDSMALLHTLMRWPQPGLQLSVVHINHGLRGEMAQRDEDFVRQYCAQHSLPLTVFREDITHYANEHKLTIEEAGREVRYLRFEQLRQELAAEWILTAHTASDQAETLLLHLIRGCGLDALQGIPAKRGHICRPLLTCDREEVLGYCRDNEVPFILDETNQDTQYTRNRIRHQVLPLLREINPSVDTSLLRFQRHLSEDVALLNELSCDLLSRSMSETGICINPLQEASGPLRRRAIRLLLRQYPLKTIEEAHILAIEHLVLSGNGKTLLPNKHCAQVYNGVLTIKKVTKKVKTPESTPISELPTSFMCGDKEYTLSLQQVDQTSNVHNLFANRAFDYATIQGGLFIRTRRTGDSLRPAGRGISKSLKKLMNEWKIPTEQRDSYPLICDEAGVLLVPGYACDQRAAITTNTKQIVVIQVP